MVRILSQTERAAVYNRPVPELRGYQRVNGKLAPILNMVGWVSPRLTITFGWRDGDLCLLTPAGNPLLSYVEIDEDRTQARREAAAARQQAEAAERQSRAKAERVERLAARLRELGIDPE